MKKPVCVTLSEKNIERINMVVEMISAENNSKCASRSEALDVTLDAFWEIYGESASVIATKHFGNGYDKDDKRKGRKWKR